jgi:hypothetical protein
VKHLLPRTQQKRLNLLRSNSSEIDDNDDDGSDEIDLHIAYRRQELEKCSEDCQHDEDEELSDYVLVRLALARAKAMQLYKEA